MGKFFSSFPHSVGQQWETEHVVQQVQNRKSYILASFRVCCNQKRNSIFKDPPFEFDQKGAEGETVILSQMLKWFSDSVLEETFYEINVDSSLCEDDILEYFDHIQTTAKKVLNSNAVVVVFLDGMSANNIPILI